MGLVAGMPAFLLRFTGRTGHIMLGGLCALNAVLDTIARSVLRRSLVKFRGFGSFSIKRRRARVVRHPENGSKLFVHESSTMKFRPSSRLWKK